MGQILLIALKLKFHSKYFWLLLVHLSFKQPRLAESSNPNLIVPSLIPAYLSEIAACRR